MRYLGSETCAEISPIPKQLAISVDERVADIVAKAHVRNDDPFYPRIGLALGGFGIISSSGDDQRISDLA